MASAGPAVTGTPGKAFATSAATVSALAAVRLAMVSFATPASARAKTYICPMHPEVVKDGKGSCPICGMDLVPKEETPSAPAAAHEIWICPMHPEIRQDHPGNCPKCGMTLEPLLPELNDEENPELVDFNPVSYTHLRAHETVLDLVCRLLLEKKKKNNTTHKVNTQVITKRIRHITILKATIILSTHYDNVVMHTRAITPEYM